MSEENENGRNVAQETNHGEESNERSNEKGPRSRNRDLPHPSERHGVEEYQRPQFQDPITDFLPHYGQCWNCEGHIQDIKNFSPEVREILKKLGLKHLNDVIALLSHELEIVIPNRLNPGESNDIINDLLRFLERCRPTGQKCALCLMDYVFQRIGCSELASEIKFTPYMGFEWASTSL